MALARLTLASLAVATLATAASACGTVSANATYGGPDPDAGPGLASGDDGPGSLGNVPPLPDGASGFCSGPNTPIVLPNGQCTGDVGRETFLFAACACTTMQIVGSIDTDARDSTTGATGNGASIGADTSLKALSTINIKGSVWAGGSNNPVGTPAIEFDGSGIVTRQLHAGGDFTTKKAFTVEQDAYVSGDFFAAPTLTCDGVVHVSPGGNTTNVSAAGGIQSGTNLVVADPCDCSKPLAIRPIVDAFAAVNDDAAAGLDHTSFVQAPAKPVSLPCGRYYFDSIAGDTVTLVLTGRTAVFVAGDVHVKTLLDVELAPGAELDLFVSGNLVLDGDANLGSPDAPAHARVYVGGNSMAISGRVKIGANLYAPNADMSISADFEMSGALLVHSLAMSGNFAIHYDVSILDVAGCQAGAKTCTTCHDCAGATPACRAGSCAPCVINADCCAPLVCHSGACVADLK